MQLKKTNSTIARRFNCASKTFVRKGIMSKSRIALTFSICLAALTITMCCKQTRTTTENAQGIAPENGKQTAAVKQGITGRVEIWEGNFMPMIDKQNTNNK